MSIPILNQLHNDFKRLTIAGSDLAAGDLGLKKKIPVLSKMGERAPVFTRLASLTEELVNGVNLSTKTLMEASQLLTSVMSTMGKTGEEGELTAEVVDNQFTTKLSYLTLKPIMEALTSKGSGRMEVIKEANESGKMYDLRLTLPLIYALDDSYPEIADYVGEEILPKYGNQIISIIKSSFSLKGKKGDGRKLKAMAKIWGEEGLPFYLDCLENGSVQVKQAALEILADYHSAEHILIEHTQAKNVDTRRMAYKGLLKQESPTAAEVILKSLGSKDCELIIDLAVQGSSLAAEKSILEFAENLYTEFLESKTQENQRRLLRTLYCIRTIDVQAVQFFKKLIEDSKVPNEVARIAALAIFSEDKNLLEYAESIFHLSGRTNLADISLLASLMYRSKEEVYNLYSRYVKRTRKDPAGNAILGIMDRIIFFKEALRDYDEQYRKHVVYRYHSDDIEFNNDYFLQQDWDERWVDLLMEIDEEKLVYRIANRVVGRAHIDYLLNKFSLNPYFSSNRGMGVMTSLVQINYEHVFEVLVDTLKKTDVNMKSVKFHTSAIVENIGLFGYLSKDLADELEQVALKIIEHERLRERLLEIVFEMRSKEEI